jgi:hypothetical protein
MFKKGLLGDEDLKKIFERGSLRSISVPFSIGSTPPFNAGFTINTDNSFCLNLFKFVGILLVMESFPGTTLGLILKMVTSSQG